MTRKELIKAIYKTTDLWSCPNDPCDLPEEEGNTGECCWKCAEKQLAEYEAKIRLAEYEAKIRADAIDDFKNYLLKHKRLVRDLETRGLYEAIKIEFVSDITLEQLKEQNK